MSTTYADRVAAHDPGAVDAARALVQGMGAELHRSWTRPGAFVDAVARRARQLPPAHLPWFWDTVGHRLIGYGSRPGGRAYVAARGRGAARSARRSRLPQGRRAALRPGRCHGPG
ncbi:hypothetical protein [Streptomyces sp. NPDC002232]|uniref:hypothetical protein n=1 Tax=Streptomyces sp. NPDC002232 TaxID=3364640 RepID=UPI00368EF3A7